MAKPSHYLFQAERIRSLLAVTMDIDEYPRRHCGSTVFQLLSAPMADAE
jgi:hypothetical protein